MSAIDTLESKLSRYSIPNLTLILLAGQFLALITTTIKPQSLSNYLLNGHALFSGQVWRAVTFLFVPVETNYFFAAFFFLMFYYLAPLSSTTGAMPATTSTSAPPPSPPLSPPLSSPL